jgi:hypothetical protein
MGAGVARKIVAYTLCVPVFTTGAGLILLQSWLIYEALTERPIDVWGSLVPLVPISVVALAGVYVIGACGCVLVCVVRYAVWLDGTRVGERVLLRTKWVDLVTANVAAAHDPRRGGVSLVVARSPDSGVEVQLPVSQGPYHLPSDELIALADAMTETRSRGGPDDRAFVIADQLRQRAASPAVTQAEA